MKLQVAASEYPQPLQDDACPEIWDKHLFFEFLLSHNIKCSINIMNVKHK